MNIIQLVVLLGFFSLSINASVEYDHVLNTNSLFTLSIEDADIKLENALFLEETLLKNFVPSDVRVLKKIVNGRDFELLIEKKIFGFTKRFTILGTIQVSKESKDCSLNETGYSVFFDFSQSGEEVTDAVAAFGLSLCTNTANINALTVKTKNALYYRGKKYGMITEPIAKSVLNDQVQAFFTAVKSTAKELK